MHYFIMKIKKQGVQQISFYRSSDIHSKDFMNLYKKCTENRILFYLSLSMNVNTNHDN